MRDIQLDDLINIKIILPIIDIIDDYPRLIKEIDKFISLKNSNKYISDLNSYLYNQKKKMISKKSLDFYNNNKDSCDTINGICGIWHFLIAYMNDDGTKELLDKYYNYFIDHRDQLNNIKELLNRLLELHISKISLVEHLDFTNKIFDRSVSINMDKDIYYLDNIIVIPNYFNDKIVYKSTDSPYIIKTSFIGNEISKYGNEIVVNSLLFDKNRLPKELTKEYIFDAIIKLRQDKKDTIDVLHNAVDLDTEINDLSVHQKYLSNLIDRIQDVNTKKELILVLKDIELTISKLSTISEKYDNILLQMDENITEKELSNEKKYYKLVRENSRYDID